MERLRHCMIDRGSSSWLQCEVAKYSYIFSDPKYRSAPVIVPPMVEGHWVFETIVFVCFSSCVLWPLKTAMWVLRLIKVLRGIKDWVNEDAYYGSIRKFDLVLRKWELFRTVTSSLSERLGWELPTVTWYGGCTAGRQYRELHIGLDCCRSRALWSPEA